MRTSIFNLRHMRQWSASVATVVLGACSETAVAPTGDDVTIDVPAGQDVTDASAGTDAATSATETCAPGAHRVLVLTAAVCVVRADHTVWCLDDANCGYCMAGQPGGTPHQVAQLPPVVELAGNMFLACALTQDGRVFCWGHDNALGNPAALNTPQQVAGLPPLVAIEAGPGVGVCGRTAGGAIYCWLQPGDGACLGSLGFLKQATLVPLDGTRGIASDGTSLCGQGADGQVRCCADIYGELPSGGPPYPGPHLVAGLAGTHGLRSGDLLCAVTDAGAPRCGLGTFGVPIAFGPTAALAATQMGPVRIALDSSRRVCFAACGGQVYCSTSKCADVVQPDVVGCVDGDLHLIATPGSVIDLASARGTVCALTSTDDVWCWSTTGDWVFGGSKPDNAPEKLSGLGQ